MGCCCNRDHRLILLVQVLCIVEPHAGGQDRRSGIAPFSFVGRARMLLLELYLDEGIAPGPTKVERKL